MKRKTKAIVAASFLLPGGIVALVLLAVVRWPSIMPKIIRNAAMKAIALLPGRQAVRDALRTAAQARSLDPAIPDAIGWVESRWDLSAIGDGGESLGPTQIRRTTLARNGYDGDPMEITRNPILAAEWTARLLTAGAFNAEGVALRSTPATLDDAIAWWNAGKQDAASLPEGGRTLTDYLPKARAAYEAIA